MISIDGLLPDNSAAPAKAQGRSVLQDHDPDQPEIIPGCFDYPVWMVNQVKKGVARNYGGKSKCKMVICHLGVHEFKFYGLHRGLQL